MALRTAGVTEPAGAGSAVAFALAACGEEEQALTANRLNASTQKSLCMVFRGSPREARHA
jgi:hypothetical protein